MSIDHGGCPVLPAVRNAKQLTNDPRARCGRHSGVRSPAELRGWHISFAAWFRRSLACGKSAPKLVKELLDSNRLLVGSEHIGVWNKCRASCWQFRRSDRQPPRLYASGPGSASRRNLCSGWLQNSGAGRFTPGPCGLL